MKLHNTAVDRLVRLNDLFSGRKDNAKLIEELNKLDFTVYEQKTGNKILVLTEEYQEKKHPIK